MTVLEKAYWKTHKYKRHSVEKDVKTFCGWPLLLKLIGSCSKPIVKALIACLFETGGRVSEVLSLRVDMFQVNKQTQPPIIIVSGMPLFKRYEKVDTYLECLKCGAKNEKASNICVKCGSHDLKKRFVTKRLEEVRNDFSIRADEPLAKIMVQHIVEVIENRKEEFERLKQKCLKENRKPTQNETDYMNKLGYIFLNPLTMKPYTRKWAYKVLRKAGKEIGVYFYNHRLRAERASHLGRSLRAESLLEWFSWEKWETAKIYARKGPERLAEEMGVTIKPQPQTEQESHL